MEILIGRSALKVAVQVRDMSSELLPLDNSFIPFDILFKIGIAHFENQELTLKSLFTGLPHSEMGIRYHFRRLLANGWIELHPSKTDRRTKLVTATPRLLDQLMLLDLAFAKMVEQHGQDTDARLADANGLPSGSIGKPRAQ
jgi:hypothetical protein